MKARTHATLVAATYHRAACGHRLLGTCFDAVLLGAGGSAEGAAWARRQVVPGAGTRRLYRTWAWGSSPLRRRGLPCSCCPAALVAFGASTPASAPFLWRGRHSPLRIGGGLRRSTTWRARRAAVLRLCHGWRGKLRRWCGVSNASSRVPPHSRSWWPHHSRGSQVGTPPEPLEEWRRAGGVGGVVVYTPRTESTGYSARWCLVGVAFGGP